MRINSVSDCFQSELFNRIESPLHGNALDVLIFSNLPPGCEVFWSQTRVSNFLCEKLWPHLKFEQKSW